MKKFGKKVMDVNVLEDVICDFYDKSCKIVIGETTDEKGSLEDVVNYEYATLSWDWGYGSRFDDEKGELHICQDCWENLLKQYKKV